MASLFLFFFWGGGVRGEVEGEVTNLTDKTGSGARLHQVFVVKQILFDEMQKANKK